MALEIEGGVLTPGQIPVDIEFRSLCFRVPSRTESEGGFEILNRLNGICRSGRLLAIMGPSGAGKTTLLDILAGNIFGGRVEGEILANGRVVLPSQMAKLSCYVMQHPVLLSSATVQYKHLSVWPGSFPGPQVKEALMTSALLRLSKSISISEKTKLVDEIIDELGLSECMNVLIGSELEGIKGISGGQIRRLAVGIELVTRPRVIVLDEPTSGLDSEIALTIMHTLKTLAQNRRTVVCSIHQPNSDIADTFDDFHLLAKGRTVYAGAWTSAVDFFSKTGYVCPTYKNPTDYFMTVLKDEAKAKSIADQFAADAAAEQKESSKESNTKSEQLNDFTELTYDPTVGSTPIWYQAYVLWIRFFRTWVRNPILLWSELGQYVFSGVLIGLLYFDVGDDLNFGTIDRYASHFFALAALMIVPSFSAVTTWDTQRKLVKVETNRKSYELISYYVAKTATTWPVEISLTFIMSLITYWMIGYQKGAAKFFTYFLVLAVFQLISETTGLISAFLTSHSQYGMILLNIIMMLGLSFTGFLVRDIPVYFEWVAKIAYVNYAATALLKAEFDGISFTHPNGSRIEGHELLRKDPFRDDDLLESIREGLRVLTNDLTVAENIWVLVGILAGMELVCFVALVLAKKNRFL